MRNCMRMWHLVFYFLLIPAVSFGETTFFQENFDDTNFSSRGWYDITGGTISTTEHITGSTGSLECRFLLAGLGCNGKNPGRHKFTPSNSVYVSYWVKHSSNWQGSGTTKTYHPHVIYLLTTENGDWDGLAYDHLTAYIEENRGYPYLAIQDGQNIDESRIGVDLTNVTENRAVAGCNGTPPNMGQERVDCYLSGSVHWNGTGWRGTTPYFFDAIEKTEWHFVEAYFQLNTIVNGVGQQNGIVRYWYDGQLVIDHSNVILRTGEYPSMQFNQMIIAPYIGDGSPADQTFWIDNMTIANERPGSSDMFIINASAGPGGTINPSGSFNAEVGSILTLTVTPNAGFQVSSVTGCDGRLVDDKYITAPITANCSVFATFSPIPNLLWSSTFDCADWSAPAALSCDAMEKHGDWYCNQGGTFYEQITAAASNLTGNGGKGLRHWVGDGVNINSGGVNLNLPSSQQELWIRWYMRYQPGFKWADIGYQKLLYFPDLLVVELYGMNGWRISDVGGYYPYQCTDCGYLSLFPDGQSDGSWHYFEVHLKMDTNGSDGIVELWVDGIQKIHVTNAHLGTTTWASFFFLSNQQTPNNGGCAYVDLDDMAISNIGYIGPISGSQFIVTPVAGPNGTISPSSPVVVNSGSTQIFTITPDSGYHIESVTGCGGSLSDNIYTTGPITSNCTVSALFDPDSTVLYTVTGLTLGSGTISPSSQTVPSGSTATLTVTPDDGNYIVSVTGCSGNLDGSIYTTGVIAADCTVTATFAINGSPPPLLWSTTYNCADWNNYSDPLACDGLLPYGGWTCDQGGTFYEQITSAANNPIGGGGKGQRNWSGDGNNEGSGQTVINLATPQSELWIRWYMRYQSGFKWSSLDQDFLLYLTSPSIAVKFSGWDTVNIVAGGTNHQSTTGGWDTIMANGAIDPATGHRTSDGQFHLYEIHVKNNGTTGIAEFWVDGVKHTSYNNVNFGTDFTKIVIGAGQSSPNNGSCYYVDYDDVAISNTGYIGPIPAGPYTITTSTGGGGSIALTVLAGSNQTFMISPSLGYYTVDVKVDGVSQGAITSYTFTDIRADHSLTTNFAAP